MFFWLKGIEINRGHGKLYTEFDPAGAGAFFGGMT